MIDKSNNQEIMLADYPKYRYLTWLATWKIFSYIHGRGVWYPWLLILLAIAFSIKAVTPAPIADYMIIFSLVTYLCELPLLILLARKAQTQSIRDLGILRSDVYHVQEGLKLAGVKTIITDDMSYRDFVVCGMISDLARLHE